MYICICASSYCSICCISSAIYLLFISRLRVEDATSPNPSPAGGIAPRNSGGAEPQKDNQESRPVGKRKRAPTGGPSRRPSEPYLHSVANHIYTALRTISTLRCEPYLDSVANYIYTVSHTALHLVYHTALYVSSYCSKCVLTLSYMCARAGSMCLVASMCLPFYITFLK
jgi:hypothetical protein